MKTIVKTLLALSLAVTAAISCTKEGTPVMNAFSVTSLKAEALPGAIRLSWDVPQSKSFLYFEVTWLDHATGKTRRELFSRYTNSLYIDGLLNRYGNYRFEFTPYGKGNTKGQTVYIERQCEKAPSYYVVTGEDVIPLSPSQVSTNAQEPSEGPVSHLVDGDPDTFFQSFWDEWTYPELKPAGYHYVVFDLHKEVTAFKFKHWNRKKGGSLPKSVNIYVGNDGQTWTLFKQLENLPTDAGSTYESEVFLTDGPVSQVKYEVIKGSDIYQVYFSLAEIEFYEVLRELVDPEVE